MSGRSRPENHCAINIAIYKPRSRRDPRGNRWAMTERPQGQLARSQRWISIGPSSMRWENDALVIDIDEYAFPIPGRVRGRIEVYPRHICDREFALDAKRRHLWRPISPCAEISVSMASPEISWQGSGYVDENYGTEPLEEGFDNWHWSRAVVGKEAVILYDIVRRGGRHAALALRVRNGGEIAAFEPPTSQTMPTTTIWRMGRKTRSDGGASPVTTLEDTPFYARSQIKTRLLGREAEAMHESLALNRLRSPVVKSLLPWRMPRQFW
jgi:carotenoid 1,2-hydratase